MPLGCNYLEKIASYLNTTQIVKYRGDQISNYNIECYKSSN